MPKQQKKGYKKSDTCTAASMTLTTVGSEVTVRACVRRCIIEWPVLDEQVPVHNYTTTPEHTWRGEDF